MASLPKVYFRTSHAPYAVKDGRISFSLGNSRLPARADIEHWDMTWESVETFFAKDILVQVCNNIGSKAKVYTRLSSFKAGTQRDILSRIGEEFKVRIRKSTSPEDAAWCNRTHPSTVIQLCKVKASGRSERRRTAV